jgi:hypothetical protein
MVAVAVLGLDVSPVLPQDQRTPAGRITCADEHRPGGSGLQRGLRRVTFSLLWAPLSSPSLLSWGLQA